MAKWILLISLMATALWSSASTSFDEVDVESLGYKYETVRTWGRSFGMCDGGPGSYMCFDRLKQRAEDEARRDAEYTCRYRLNGRLEYFPLYCNKYCSPFNLPYNAPMQNVNCQANCDFRCVIETEN